MAIQAKKLIIAGVVIGGAVALAPVILGKVAHSQYEKQVEFSQNSQIKLKNISYTQNYATSTVESELVAAGKVQNFLESRLLPRQLKVVTNISHTILGVKSTSYIEIPARFKDIATSLWGVDAHPIKIDTQFGADGSYAVDLNIDGFTDKEIKGLPANLKPVEFAIDVAPDEFSYKLDLPLASISKRDSKEEVYKLENIKLDGKLKTKDIDLSHKISFDIGSVTLARQKIRSLDNFQAKLLVDRDAKDFNLDFNSSIDSLKTNRRFALKRSEFEFEIKKVATPALMDLYDLMLRSMHSDGISPEDTVKITKIALNLLQDGTKIGFPKISIDTNQGSLNVKDYLTQVKGKRIDNFWIGKFQYGIDNLKLKLSVGDIVLDKLILTSESSLNKDKYRDDVKLSVKEFSTPFGKINPSVIKLNLSQLDYASLNKIVNTANELVTASQRTGQQPDFSGAFRMQLAELFKHGFKIEIPELKLDSTFGKIDSDLLVAHAPTTAALLLDNKDSVKAYISELNAKFNLSFDKKFMNLMSHRKQRSIKNAIANKNLVVKDDRFVTAMSVQDGNYTINGVTKSLFPENNEEQVDKNLVEPKTSKTKSDVVKAAPKVIDKK